MFIFKCNKDLQIIKWAHDLFNSVAGYVGIDFGGFTGAVAE